MYATLNHLLHGLMAIAIVLIASSAGAAEPLQLRKGDQIAIIGNTMADRLQHADWLDTYLHATFPDYDLVCRNLGYPGDELKIRNREENFGSPDEWLTKVRANVVLCFFGYNEALKGPAALDTFKKDLAETIDSMLAQKYDGQSPPRLVFFSPIAHEDLQDPNLPNGETNNKNLAIYTQAMREVCESKKVSFVDLFEPSKNLYAKSSKPLTMNGIHLLEDGEKAISEVILKSLFPNEKPKANAAQLDKLQRAVADRNYHWYSRYRVVDGYNVFGGRSKLAWFGQSNADVMMREMEIFDVKTANRDKQVWAIAKGSDLVVKDDNLPPELEVKTNIPGALPDGKHNYLGGEEAISKMKVAQGMKVNLFASEEMFPELINPVQMAVDPDGRLFASVWPSYPHWNPTQPRKDRIICLPDDNGDGVADRCVTFADELNSVTGFEFWNNGVIVAQGPDVLFLKDTNGDDKYDIKERIIHGLDTADTHHTANSFVLDPGGAIYFQEGTFHHSQVESPWGPVRRVANGAVFRYEPRAQKFDVYVSFGFANPHGHAFDHWGQDFVYDGTGSNPYHAALFSGDIDFPNKHARPPQVYQQRTRPCPGVEFLASSHFPEELRGNLLVGNVIGFQGILQYKMADKSASFGATEVEPIVSSSDPNFRPADLETAPDGTIYFTDWQNPIIGHMQHNLRDPSRDRIHGRVYRVRAEGRDLLKPTPIAGEPIAKLLDLLKEKDDRIRYRTRIELSGRDSAEVTKAAQAWLAALVAKDPAYEHHALEVLWLHQSHNVINADLLKKTLKHPVRPGSERSNTIDPIQISVNGKNIRVGKECADNSAPSFCAVSMNQVGL